jgi:cytochrome c556
MFWTKEEDAMSIEKWGFGAVTLLALVSCRAKSEVVPEATAVARAPAASAANSSSSSSVSGSAQATLDRMDTRTPVPLLPMMAHHQKQNMRDHLAAVQQIIVAVASKDFAAVQKAAARIGFSETMGQMCSHMGAGAPGFTDTALRFHHDADKIADAARKRDTEAVLGALGQTLSQCTGCHEQYKQHVVDETDWSKAAGGAQPPQHHSP